MIVTKEKAKEMWCPYQLDFEECRDGVVPIGGHCSAALCMAWRWYDMKEGTGYCGKVGKPDNI